MQKQLIILLCVLLHFVCAQFYNSTCQNAGGQTIYQFNATTLGGTNINFNAYKGRVVLLANVASFWGLTVANYLAFNQIAALFPSNSTLFDIIGFPCWQFFNQEPGTNAEILNCLKYVRPGNGFVPAFNLFQLIEVNGATTAPIYVYLKGLCPQPSPNLTSPQFIDWSPITPADITWNFEKFLITKQGVPYKRYNPETNPMMLVDDIKFLLSQ